MQELAESLASCLGSDAMHIGHYLCNVAIIWEEGYSCCQVGKLGIWGLRASMLYHSALRCMLQQVFYLWLLHILLLLPQRHVSTTPHP